MLKQLSIRMKIILVILLAILFVTSLSAVAVEAHGGGSWGHPGWGWGRPWGGGWGYGPGFVRGWAVIAGFALHTRECHIPFKIQHLPLQRLQPQVQI